VVTDLAGGIWPAVIFLIIRAGIS